MNKILLIAISFLLMPSQALAGKAVSGRIYETFPEKINADEKYVFYSHGFIVEGTNPKPVNKRWGIYDFPGIKTSLSDSTYNLIAYHRPSDSDPYAHADKLVADITELISHGVNASNITVIGFSRGSFITGLVSHKLAHKDLNTVLLAGCGRVLWDKKANIKLSGRVLSMFETSDQSLSCKEVQSRSPVITSFKEIALSTGEEHGAFYRPISEWVVPVKHWIKSGL